MLNVSLHFSRLFCWDPRILYVEARTQAHAYKHWHMRSY